MWNCFYVYIIFTGTQQTIAVFLAVFFAITTTLAVTASVILGVIVYKQKKKGRLDISKYNSTANELNTITNYASIPIDLKKSQVITVNAIIVKLNNISILILFVAFRWNAAKHYLWSINTKGAELTYCFYIAS